MRKDIISIVLLAVAVIVFFWETVTLQGTFFIQDVMVQNYPFRHFFSEALKHFEFPLWHPGINCGFPLFAEGQSGILYPFNFFSALLLPTWVGINYNVAFHLWLGGVGTFLYLRVIGVSPVAATTAGMTYALSGYIVVRAMSQNFVDVSGWLPFLFLFLEIAIKRRNWRYVFLFGAVFALQLLAGHPQAALYAAIAAFFYAVYRGWVAYSGGSTKGSLLHWLCGVLAISLLGVGLAAVQVLPTYELVQLSGRSEGLSYEQFVKMSLPPERLVTLLLPNFFGNSGAGSYWTRESGFFIQLCAYVGVLPLLLAVLGMRAGKDSCALFFSALVVSALVLSLGKYTVLYRVLYELPGLNFFRIPTRFLLWWAFGSAVLCGIGFDCLRTGFYKKWWFGSLFVATLVMAGAAFVNWEVLSAGNLSSPELTARNHFREGLIEDLLRSGLVIVFSVPLGFASFRQRMISWIMPLIVFADLADFGRRFNAVISPQAYTDVPKTVGAIKAHAATVYPEDDIPDVGRFRCVSFVSERGSGLDWHSGWINDDSSYLFYPETIRMYTGSQFELANTLPGWSPLHLSRHWEFARGYSGFESLANVRYIVSHSPLKQSGLRQIYKERLFIYENTKVLPRAFLVDDYEVISGRGNRLRRMRNRNFISQNKVIFEREPLSKTIETPGSSVQSQTLQTAHISQYESDFVAIDVSVSRPTFLVLSDTFYPGWRASIDGRDAPLMLANHVFRAVSVLPGDQRVEMRFESISFRIGLTVTIISLGIWVLGFILVKRQKFQLRLGPNSANFRESSHVFSWISQIVTALIFHALIRQWGLWAGVFERSRLPATWF